MLTSATKGKKIIMNRLIVVPESACNVLSILLFIRKSSFMTYTTFTLNREVYPQMSLIIYYKKRNLICQFQKTPLKAPRIEIPFQSNLAQLLPGVQIDKKSYLVQTKIKEL